MKIPRLRKGTKVIILRDVRKNTNAVAAGKVATVIGFTKKGGWILYNRTGQPRRESVDLPRGYAVWVSGSDFPKKRCGLHNENPIFTLPDGQTITGLECYWWPLNGKIAVRIFNELQDHKRRQV